ncbi:MAG: transglutaminase family protein [Pseudomonadota bacterium]
MHLRISHSTTYAYDRPVDYALQQVRLTPKNRKTQNIIEWKIDVEGGRCELEYEDQNNNRVTLIRVDEGVEAVAISASGIVETNDSSGIIGQHGGFAPLWYFNRSTDLTQAGSGIKKLVSGFSKFGDDDVSRLHALSGKILEAVGYETGTTNTATSAEEALASGSGVCQDHTHILLSAARHLGFPARYVSGYLMLTDQIDQDASHAWSEVFIQGIGWLGLDVSNGISPDERYVPIATGLDYLETAPIFGMRLGAGEESMIVNLQVQQ